MFQGLERDQARNERSQARREKENEMKCLEAELQTRCEKYDFGREAYIQSRVTQWEYLQLSDKDPDYWKKIKNLGIAGWELVGMATITEGGQIKLIHTQYVFKRPLITLPEELSEQYSDIKILKQEISRAKTQLEELKTT